jgi:tetratricopeptide (TPR) repeat protein
MSLFDKRTKKEKLWDKARKAIKKNDWDSAIETFKEILEINIKDHGVLHRLAELYEKKGDKSKAIQYYIKAADYYAKDGFSHKAIAILNQVLALDDSLLDVKEKIAQLRANLKGAFLLP